MWRRMGFELDVRLLGKLLPLSSRVNTFFIMFGASWTADGGISVFMMGRY